MRQFFPDAEPVVDALVLVAMVVGLRVLTYVILRLRTRSKQNE